MGFVYNNPWEAFCKTYFELHGYFVTTNLFAALLSPVNIDQLQHQGIIEVVANSTGKKPDKRRSRIEADLVAFRVPGTHIGTYEQDRRSNNSHEGEFFAGDETDSGDEDGRVQQLIYVEVRANLTNNQPEQQIRPFFGSGRDRRKVKRMTEVLSQRFPDFEPLVVIMACHIAEDQKTKIAETAGWKFKEFRSVFEFIERRMNKQYEVKKRVQYNDPFLEFFRFMERIRPKEGDNP